MTREERSAYYKKWYAEHKEYCAEKHREWYIRKQKELKEMRMKAAAYDRIMNRIGGDNE